MRCATCCATRASTRNRGSSSGSRSCTATSGSSSRTTAPACRRANASESSTHSCASTAAPAAMARPVDHATGAPCAQRPDRGRRSRRAGRRALRDQLAGLAIHVAGAGDSNNSTTPRQHTAARPGRARVAGLPRRTFPISMPSRTAIAWRFVWHAYALCITIAIATISTGRSQTAQAGGPRRSSEAGAAAMAAPCSCIPVRVTHHAAVEYRVFSRGAGRLRSRSPLPLSMRTGRRAPRSTSIR